MRKELAHRLNQYDEIAKARAKLASEEQGYTSAVKILNLIIWLSLLTLFGAMFLVSHWNLK